VDFGEAIAGGIVLWDCLEQIVQPLENLRALQSELLILKAFKLTQPICPYVPPIVNASAELYKVLQ